MVPTNSPAANPTHRRVVYRSAVDAWLAALLGFPIVASLAIGGYLILVNRPDDAMVMLLTGLGIALVTMALTIPCRYTLLEDALSIRCGLICYQVPYETIRNIRMSSSWLSGPALSLRRVEIETARRKHILSPQNRERFTEQLNERIASS